MFISSESTDPPADAREAALRFRCEPYGCSMGGGACAQRFRRVEAAKAADRVKPMDEFCVGCHHGEARARLLDVEKAKAPPKAGNPWGRRTKNPPIETKADGECRHLHVVPLPHNHHWAACAACGDDSFPNSPEAAGRCPVCESYYEHASDDCEGEFPPAPPPASEPCPCERCSGGPGISPAPAEPDAVDAAEPGPAPLSEPEAERTDEAAEPAGINPTPDPPPCARCEKRPARPASEVYPDYCKVCASSAMSTSGRLCGMTAARPFRREVEKAWLEGGTTAARAKGIEIGAIVMCRRCERESARPGAKIHPGVCAACYRGALKASARYGKMRQPDRRRVEAAWLEGGAAAAAEIAGDVLGIRNPVQIEEGSSRPKPVAPDAARDDDGSSWQDLAAASVSAGAREVRERYSRIESELEAIRSDAATVRRVAEALGIEVDLPDV